VVGFFCHDCLWRRRLLWQIKWWLVKEKIKESIRVFWMLDYKSISNGEAKLIAKNKKLIFWLFFAYFSYSKGKVKQNVKMHFLSHKYYSYVFLKRTKTNKVGPTKK
jgi:hypothetical protein